MQSVKFEDGDAWLLSCIHQSGCDLECLIHVYTFVARDAIPSYERVAGCLSRAVRAGLMPIPTGGRFCLVSDWYQRIHSLDDKYPASEFGLLEFEETFVVQEWPQVEGCDFVLPMGDYQQAAAKVRNDLNEVFGRR